MERNRSTCRWLALATRLKRLANRVPLVISRTVLSNPAPRSDCATTSASLRLNSYSGTPRALSAPGEVAVWPTSIRTRNVERAQLAWSLVSCVAVSAARSGCQTVPARITARATIRIDASLLTTMGQNLPALSASLPSTDAFCGIAPKRYTCLSAVVLGKPDWLGFWTRRKCQSKSLFPRQGSLDVELPIAIFNLNHGSTGTGEIRSLAHQLGLDPALSSG